MTKEDRYAHLGDGIDEETTDDGEIVVRLQDGDEETVLRFDPGTPSPGVESLA